jgi:hypothetical protein
MRIFLLAPSLLFLSAIGSAQTLTVNDFVSIPAMPQKKIAGYLSKIGFAKGETLALSDTLMQNYYVKNTKSNFIDYSDSRIVQSWYTKHKSGFAFYTSSQKDCVNVIKTLKDGGFFCENENVKSPFIYQKDDILVKLSSTKEDTSIIYKFFVVKEPLPHPKNIRFAEDFLSFQSHENLAYVFGKANVQKDVYYFSDSNVVRSSVLYPNTNRQVIFVWHDEVNRCDLSHLLIGNSLRGSAGDRSEVPVAENVWTLRNGLRANMSLTELVKLNKSTINFYGWESHFPGIVEPGKTGEIDFAKTGVVLSCLNCRGSEFMNKDIINSDDALKNSMRLFVLALIVMPQPALEEEPQPTATK